MKPTFFDSAATFRAWLARHHASEAELWVGFWKAHTGKGGLSYLEAVEQALCYGWIDGLVRRHDEASYMQRFTRRRPASIWSRINVERVEALEKRGLMTDAGRAAFAHRTDARTGVYSSENRDVVLDAKRDKAFRAKRKAWAWFESQPPGYRRLAAFWVMSAKREETRDRRFAQLVADCARGVRIAAVDITAREPARRR